MTDSLPADHDPASDPHASSAPAASARAEIARAEIARLHRFDRRPLRNLGPMQAAAAGLAAASAAAWLDPASRPALLLIWPAYAYVLWQATLAFHDAGHGRFHPRRRANELFGHLVGTLCFVPLAAYRHAHARHHACLGSPRDPELWPFTLPQVPRPLRVLAAALEVLFGFVYTPLLFLRGAADGSLPPAERRGVLLGYAACGVTWAGIFGVVHGFGLWGPFLAGGVVPFALAGAAQTLNKYAEHLGLHGRSVLGLTRTVAAGGPAAAAVSAAVLHVDAHGTHHRYAKIPHYNLPAATPYALAGGREPCPVFPSLAAAVLDMLPHLADPKVGPQWAQADTADASPPTPAPAYAAR